MTESSGAVTAPWTPMTEFQMTAAAPRSARATWRYPAESRGGAESHRTAAAPARADAALARVDRERVELPQVPSSLPLLLRLLLAAADSSQDGLSILEQHLDHLPQVAVQLV